jgi:hypothetical protein
LQATESGVPLDAFRIRPQLEDESGNQSDRFVAATEPVWKVTTVTVETEKYPFPPAAVRSFQCAMPAPGATVQVPLTPQDEADGLSVILVAGKGTHRFNAAKMTLEPASGTGSLAGPAHFTIDSFGVFVHSATSMAASDWSNEQLRLVRFRPGSDGPWRRHEMDGASTSWGRGSAEASVMLNWDIHSSAAPPPGTLCEFQFIRLHPQTNEFYVTNPLLKSGPAAATSATP